MLSLTHPVMPILEKFAILQIASAGARWPG